jgi:hypothetical protein
MRGWAAAPRLMFPWLSRMVHQSSEALMHSITLAHVGAILLTACSDGADLTALETIGPPSIDPHSVRPDPVLLQRSSSDSVSVILNAVRPVTSYRP